MDYRIFVDKIKQSVSCRQLLETNGIRINRQGFCICPLHGDTDASLKVYKDSWHCFGCHKGGDVINLARELYRCGFNDAIERLNDEFFIGLDLNRQMTDREKNLWALQRASAEQKRRKAKRMKTQLEKNYLDSLSMFLWLDNLVQENEPTDDEWSPLFCGYLQERSVMQEYVTECDIRRMALNE